MRARALTCDEIRAVGEHRELRDPMGHADIETIRDLAGHRDISTTGRYLSTAALGSQASEIADLAFSACSSTGDCACDSRSRRGA